ncbi:MAG: hypothetical protein F9K46_02800 [Anaerolineae bacterium]|nr:MAG: hypothetical protein F9K46_02800 [Anaerolineae bacterium]
MQLTPVQVDQQLLNTLEEKLSDLASLWRGHKDQPQAEEIVRQYHVVLRCMIDLGFRAALDPDSELPKRLMPQEYHDLLQAHP